MKVFKISIILLSVFLLVTSVFASENSERPIVVIQSNVSIQGDEILLSDIASIRSFSDEGKELVNKLSNIRISNSPAPRMSREILGASIISRIEANGIATDKIAYSIPQSITVTRQGRTVMKEEVLEALVQQLATKSNLDIQIKDVQWRSGQTIPLGKTRIVAEKLGEPNSGKIPVRVAVFVNEKPEARFLATAIVDDWREAPVSNKNLDRGSIINVEDLAYVRLNLSQYPADVITNKEDIIGRQVTNRISAGEVIRGNRIDIPPTVTRGSLVTMVYVNGVFQATATGVAMEDGLKGETIRVRNDSSKAVIQASVLNKDRVEVTK